MSSMTESDSSMDQTGDNCTRAFCNPCCSSNKDWSRIGNNFASQAPTHPLTASEMQQLTVDERNKVYDDIHGVADVPEEHPELTTKLLDQVKEEIRKVKDRSAYNRAYFQAPSRVNDTKFLLVFLRAALFDPRLASKKIVAHFQNKAALFGMDKVADPITFDDLDGDDKETLLSGSLQILPETDRSGRVVIFYHGRHINAKSWKNYLRVFWYMAMIAAEDENVQKKGIVTIGYNVSSVFTKVIQDIVVNFHHIRDGIPIRWVVYHFLYDHPAIRAPMSLIQSIAGRDVRLRFQDRFGTHLECIYHLLTFGIPNSILPFNSDHELTNDVHLSQLSRRQEIEKDRKAQERLAGTVVSANNDDIVLGRGKSFQNHPGNQKLSKLIEQNQARYQQANRNEKTVISKDLVATVLATGARFLQKDEQNPNIWTVASDDIARLKVAHSFRAGKSRSTQLDDSDEGGSTSTRTVETAFSGTRDIDQSENGRKSSKMARFSDATSFDFSSWGNL